VDTALERKMMDALRNTDLFLWLTTREQTLVVRTCAGVAEEHFQPRSRGARLEPEQSPKTPVSRWRLP
jgi:hypothetical protein